ncbi:hypothetical protein BpHYR1_047613, partial [Brachionus plicatilis]
LLKNTHLLESIQVENRVRSGDEYVVKRAIPLLKLANGIYNLVLIVDADKEFTVDSKRFYAPEEIVVNVKKANPINKISINLINVTNGNSLDKLISGSLVEVNYKVETEHLEKDFKLNVWLNADNLLNWSQEKLFMIKNVPSEQTLIIKLEIEMIFELIINFKMPLKD